MNKHKNLWLMGGFGNVLFQILAFNVLSKENRNIFFVTVLTEKNFLTRLLGWTVHERLFDDLINVQKIKYMNLIKSGVILFAAFLSRKFKFDNVVATFYGPTDRADGIFSRNILGYFQHRDFLEANQQELRELGSQLRVKYGLEVNYPVVVHFRKGDSVCAANNFQYYEVIKLLLKEEESHILVITDNSNEANEFFTGINNLSIISSMNGLTDFKYLLSADKLYCAPSTFSWWAAHSLCPDAEVIMPKYFQENLGIYTNSHKLTII